MSKILQLREKRAQVWEKAKSFLDTCRDDKGLVSVEDTARYEEMEDEVVRLGKEIERLERQEALDKELASPVSQAIVANPTVGGGNPKGGRSSKAYNTAFWNNIRKKNFYDIENTLSIGDDSRGGYLVPDEYEKRLIQALQEENFMRSLATVIQTSSGERKIPVVSGNGEATWMDENSKFKESEDTFSQVTLGSHKVGTAIKISDELLYDSVFDLESYMANEFARRIGVKEEEAFLIGD